MGNKYLDILDNGLILRWTKTFFVIRETRLFFRESFGNFIIQRFLVSLWISLSQGTVKEISSQLSNTLWSIIHGFLILQSNLRCDRLHDDVSSAHRAHARRPKDLLSCLLTFETPAQKIWVIPVLFIWLRIIHRIKSSNHSPCCSDLFSFRSVDRASVFASLAQDSSLFLLFFEQGVQMPADLPELRDRMYASACRSNVW